jgi:hypothetical protein
MDIKKHADLADIMWGSDYYDVIPSIINNFNLKVIDAWANEKNYELNV